MRYSFKIAALSLLILGSLSCSVKKKGFLNKHFHSLVTRDNFYFNAVNKIKESSDILALSHIDRYDRILNPFRYADEEKAKSVGAELDVALKKLSTAISRHSMMIDAKEYNYFIDNCYLELGKSQFFKYDFVASSEAFEYVMTQYTDQESSKWAMVWLMKSYLKQKKVGDAEQINAFINNEKEWPKRLRAELAATRAWLFIEQKFYERALSEIEKAIKDVPKRYDKTRYYYIKAQLQQRIGQNKKASKTYSKVVWRNPPYELAFNAKLSKAKVFEGEGTGKLRRTLNRMLSDGKNSEYKDQIYYALGIVELKDKNIPAAVLDFRQALMKSVNNPYQKALSYYELANIYFTQHNYQTAKAYYDSTFSLLDKDSPDYEFVLGRIAGLEKLVMYQKVYILEDSLQKLIKKSPAEIEMVIQKAIDAYTLAEQKKKAAEEAKANAPVDDASGPALPGGGNWYFYNPSIVAKGMQEFTVRWGNRKLEDDWRRISKPVSFANNDEVAKQPDSKVKDSTANAGASDTADAVINDFKNKKEYYKTLPDTPEKLARSHRRTMNALHELMWAYKSQLGDYKEATKYGEELISRYPEFKNILPVYYNLYLMFSTLKDKVKADYYKNLILGKYPDSDYAQIIQDPNYLKNKMDQGARVKRYYQNTYQKYLDGLYKEVVERKSKSDSLFPKNSLMPKFDYLKALSLAKLKGVDTFEVQLKGLVKNYPKDEIRIVAEETLDFIRLLRERGADFARANMKSRYTYKQDTLHYYICAITDSSFKDQEFKDKIQIYINRYYSKEGLTLTSEKLSDKIPAVMVMTFKNMEDASDFMYRLKKDEDVLTDQFDNVNFNHFIISPNNWQRLREDKDLDGYLLFFRINYPGLKVL